MRKTLIILGLLALFAIANGEVDKNFYDLYDEQCLSEKSPDADSCKDNSPAKGESLYCCYMESEEDEKDVKKCIAVKKDKDVISDLKDQYDDKKTIKIKKIDCGSQFIKFSFAVFAIFTLF